MSRPVFTSRLHLLSHLLPAAPLLSLGTRCTCSSPQTGRKWCSVRGECLYECFHVVSKVESRRAVERQLPWPPLEHSDLASLKSELLLQEAQSDWQPANRCSRPCCLWAFRPYPVNVLLFSHLPHIKTHYANRVAFTSFHIISLKSLRGPIWLWEGVGRGRWP